MKVCLSSFFDRYSFHPSMQNTFSPFKLSYKASSWLKSCFTTMNLSPIVLLVDSVLSGNSTLNLLRKRIQLRWQMNCLSGVTLSLYCR